MLLDTMFNSLSEAKHRTVDAVPRCLAEEEGMSCPGKGSTQPGHVTALAGGMRRRSLSNDDRMGWVDE